MIEKINRELYRLSKLSNLDVIDDFVDLKPKSIFLSEIYRLQNTGSKTSPKKNFFTTLYIQEADNQKASLYEIADNFLDILENNFFCNEEELVINYKITREGMKRINSDKGKFYQYSIQLHITMY